MAILGQIHCPLSTESRLCQHWVVDSYRTQKQGRHDMINALLYPFPPSLPQFLQTGAEELSWLEDVFVFLNEDMY